MKLLKLLITGAIALFVTLFAVNNSQIVTFNLWPFPQKFQCMLSLVILVSFTLGALIAGTLVWVSQLLKRFHASTSNTKTDNTKTEQHTDDQ